MQHVLEALGLSQNEARIYRSLLHMKESSVPDVALYTGVNKRNVYDTMPKLLKKGLVSQVVGSKEARYVPVSPKKLKDLIAEKESLLAKELPMMQIQFEQERPREEVYLYKGIEGMKNHLRDMLGSGEDVYSIGAKGAWFVPGMEEAVALFLKKAHKKGMAFHHVFDHDVSPVRDDFPTQLKAQGRFFPEKYSTTGAIDIYGDRVVTFSGLTLKQLAEDVTLTVIVNRKLADCYRTWFQFMWDHCPKTQ